MNEAVSVPFNDVIHVEGNTLTLKIGDYTLSLKIQGPEVKTIGRLKLAGGRTLYDLVLDAARAFAERGEDDFSAADLYYIAKEKHPDLDIKKNSWYSHVMSSAPNHPSYRHYNSHRKYFRYLGEGKYSLEPNFRP